MEKKRHTPGPWYVSADGITVGDESGFRPFSGCGCCGSPWMSASDEDTQVADARLIAAAPELLEALQKAKAVLFPSSDEYAAAEAAIAKATGEAA